MPPGRWARHALPLAWALACTVGLAGRATAAPVAAPAATPVPDPASPDQATITDLKRQIDEMRRQYEARLKALESQLDQLRPAPAVAQTPAPLDDAGTSPGTAPQAATQAPPPAGVVPTASANAFNPMVSVILSGTYASLSKDPDNWRISGFIPGGEDTGPGPRGFNLGESEIALSANIDPWWYGALTLSVASDDTLSAEEAFVQSTALPGGLQLKAGRFFSGLGYLNEQHAHTWDFVDAPLAYQAFLGGQFQQEGAQLKWLAPTDQFIELGAELGSGRHFPGTGRDRNGAGAVSLFAHTGGDLGDSHSWRAGLAWLRTRAQDRDWDDTDAAGSAVRNAFTGSSRLWIADAVWKWAPNGNAKVTNVKLQGEYIRRTESGEVVYDTEGVALPGAYHSAQSGWYLQGIYQFTTGWRAGLRHDELDSGRVDFGFNSASLLSPDYRPRRDSVMLDWSPSEFSRWRLQLSNDRARQGVNDRQLFLQYQMSLGAHGAHSY